MADQEEWTGTISRIRIEFGHSTVTPKPEIRIDEIRFGRGFLSRIPDTGQITCYDQSKPIPCPQPGKPFYGQDAHYLIHPPRYESRNVEGIASTLDTVTTLTWRQNYDGAPRKWTEAAEFAPSTTDFNWRLPSLKELQTLLDYNASETCIDPVHFPLGKLETVWSATTRAFLARGAWALSLKECRVEKTSKDHRNHVLPVMGRPLDFDQFKRNGNGTVTDLATGMMWYEPETGEMTWREALSFCEGLDWAGHDDWRLPNIKELQSIVDVQLPGPTLDTDFFPGCRPFIYWSSTTNGKHPEFAWYVNFDDGHTYDGGLKTRKYYVRPVRSVYE
jgi:hypothetical protein